MHDRAKLLWCLGGKRGREEKGKKRRREKKGEENESEIKFITQGPDLREYIFQ